MLAYCDLSPASEGDTYVFMDSRRVPGADEAAAALLDWARAPSDELASGRTVLRTGVSARDAVKRRLLEERGYTAVRHSFQKLIELDGEPELPRWPEGIEVAQLDSVTND